MRDEMRLKLEAPSEDEKTIQQILDKLTVAVQLMNSLRQLKDSVDGRGISIAITHVETAALWFKDAVRVED